MKRIVSSGWLVATLCAGLGCGSTSYYMVKDPGTGTVYYSDKVDKQQGGAVTLTDARTKSTVTIQNSVVTTISKETFDQGVAAPAPAPAAAPAAAPPPTDTPPPPTAAPAPATPKS